jgi:hypothetical protein
MQHDDLIESGAIGLSVLCALHCLALPLMLVFAPALTGVVHMSETIHILFLLLAIPVSGWAMWQGYRRHHQMMMPVIGAIGLALMLAGVVVHDHSQALTLAGVFTLAAAHVGNWNQRMRSVSRRA